MIELIEYMKLHRLSLIQDIEKLEGQMYNESSNLDVYTQDLKILEAQVNLTRHYLSVANDILQSPNGRI